MPEPPAGRPRGCAARPAAGLNAVSRRPERRTTAERGARASTTAERGAQASVHLTSGSAAGLQLSLVAASCEGSGGWHGTPMLPQRGPVQGGHITGEAASGFRRPGPPARSGPLTSRASWSEGEAGCGRRSGRKVAGRTPSSHLAPSAVWPVLPHASPPFPAARSQRPRASDSRPRGPQALLVPEFALRVPSRGHLHHARPLRLCRVSRGVQGTGTGRNPPPSRSASQAGTAKGPRGSGGTSACRGRPAWSGPGPSTGPRRRSRRRTRRTCV